MAEFSSQLFDGPALRPAAQPPRSMRSSALNELDAFVRYGAQSQWCFFGNFSHIPGAPA
jgi:hypothetical protein